MRLFVSFRFLFFFPCHESIACHSPAKWCLCIQSSVRIYVQKSRLEMQKRSLSRLGVRLWNEIPCHMRDLPKKMFKRVLRTSLLNILQKEDDYIHIPEIIKKVGEVD